MNNRIEQLAEQVNLLGDFIPTKIPGRYAGTIATSTIEEFAELIIQECARVAFENDLKMAIGQWGADSAILKHFGVK